MCLLHRYINPSLVRQDCIQTTSDRLSPEKVTNKYLRPARTTEHVSRRSDVVLLDALRHNENDGRIAPPTATTTEVENLKHCRVCACSAVETPVAMGRPASVLAESQRRVAEIGADAKGYELMVGAFGGGKAYNLYTFSQNFKPDSIRLFFAGEGTFWTDLTRFEELGAAKLLQPTAKSKSGATPTAPRD